MKKIAFTICSNNYLAQAKTLGDTLIKYNPDYFFVIGLCDKKNNQIDYSFFGDYKIIEVQDIGIENFQEMVSKYTVLELNTSVKPFIFEYLFEKYSETETILYFDPDIAIFDNLKFIEDEFKDSSILLTPHIYTPIEMDGKTPSENTFTNYGIYNLGFIGLKRNNDSFELLSWWKNRLSVNCYNKIEEGIFVDQLPMNLAPIFFSNVYILKNLGLNMAPWNLHERKLTKKGQKYLVNSEYPLVFYHFSNYNSLHPEILASFYNRISFVDNIELREIYDEYRDRLFENNFIQNRNVECYYNSNGIYRESEISKAMKKMNLELVLTKEELNFIKTESDLDISQSSLTKVKIDSSMEQLNLVKKELESTKAQFNSANSELNNIHASLSWKIILILQKIIKFIIPEKSFRRKTAVIFWRTIVLLWRLLFRIYKGFKKEYFLFRNCIANLKPKKKRKINLKSKKIVYIGHSYHHKTKSTVFLIDYLKEFFDVTVILDESWQDKPYPNLSFIDESYLGVIFFQVLPSPKNMKEIKNNNIVYFPMYDQSGKLGIDFWNKYRDLKIINFSSTLHQKLKKWGFESIYVQYFPKVNDFLPGNKEEVFFWQRLTNISISTIIRLLDRNKVKIHIHKAIDPGQEFIQPQKEDEERWGITYSDWFKTREEMGDVIRQKGIYIAPREYEGIGLSFLEAMAMGKAVIALNNPTMNEYIENGKTGYLFDLKNPKPIDLANIKEVQKNTYEFMKNSFEKWEKDKIKIIEFIKK